MNYSKKLENKLEGDSNFRAWKTQIDLILAKNKVLDIVKGKIVEPQFEARKEKEPQNVAAMEKFKRHGGKKIFGSRKKSNHKKDMSKVQCFGCHKYGHYKHQCPELAKKRKEKHHASAANVEVPLKKAKHE